MSEEQAMAFMRAVKQDAHLRAAVTELNGADALQQLVALAAERGYHFTEPEYRAAVVSHAKESLSGEAIEALMREMGWTPKGEA